ncbi:MAG: class I SAM-dependent methyltransferase [Nitrospirae bacterium]|nr:class I SAM-dependent methyltransferase [Nitrospirota bacterium]
MKTQHVPITAEPGEYDRKKAHYQADKVAKDYDAFRWSSASRRWSNKRKLLAISKAIDLAASMGNAIHSAIDIPCGTGRIMPFLLSKNIKLTGSDISHEMMQVAQGKVRDSSLSNGFVRCDAEKLPFADGSFDSIFSIRFLFHLPTDVRRRALREMARISRRWVIVDYRHKYTMKYRLKHLKGKLGLSTKQYNRVSVEDISKDFNEAGLKLIKIFPTYPIFSDKWVILARKIQ